MYPTVIVKSSTGLLVVLLIFSEVHSFIFEDEGGTEFCLRTDNFHQNESTKIWLETSCDSGRKTELTDHLISLRFNSIPQKDFRQIPVLLRGERILQNRRNTKSRQYSSTNQAGRQRVERFSTHVNRVRYDTLEKSRSDERTTIEGKDTGRTTRRIDLRATKTNEARSADLSEKPSMEPRNIRYTRLHISRASRAEETSSTRSNIIRSRSIDIRASRSAENLSIRSRYSGQDFNNPALKLDERRITGISENRPENTRTAALRSSSRRYVKSDSNDALRSLNSKGTKFDGSVARRSVDTRYISLRVIDSTKFEKIGSGRFGVIRSLRSDDIKALKSLSIGAARSPEIRSGKPYEVRYRSMNNLASIMKDNRVSRFDLFQHSRFDSNGDIRYLDETDVHRERRFVDSRAMSMRSTKLDNLRRTRSFDNRVVRLRSRDSRSRSIDDLVSRSNENRFDQDILNRQTRSYNGDVRSADVSRLRNERRNRDRRNGEALMERNKDDISSKRMRIFSIDTERNLLNIRGQSSMNRQLEDSNTRISSLFEKNKKRENPRIVRDFRSQKDNFINSRSDRSSLHRYENLGSRTRISDSSSRYAIRGNILQRSVRETNNIKRMTKEDTQINNIRVSRNYREFQRLEDAARLGSYLILPSEGDSRRLFQDGIQARFGIGNSRNNERNIRSLDTSFVRSERNQFQRIREFGNDNRQRQNFRARTSENIRGMRDRVDIRKDLGVANLRNTYEQILSEASIRRNAERHSSNSRRHHENFRVDAIRVQKYTAGRDSRQRVRGERMVPQWEDTNEISNIAKNFRIYEHKSRTEKARLAVDHKDSDRVDIRVSNVNRVMTRRNTEGFRSMNSRRDTLEPRRSILEVSELRNSNLGETQYTARLLAGKTRRYTSNRSIRISSEKLNLDGANGQKELEPSNIDHHLNVVNRESLIRNFRIDNSNNRFATERVVLLNSRRGREYFNRDIWESAGTRWIKMDAEGDTTQRKGAVGISSYGVLQLTFATILVAQLINFTGGNSKGGYFKQNWMRKVKSF